MKESWNRADATKGEIMLFKKIGVISICLVAMIVIVNGPTLAGSESTSVPSTTTYNNKANSETFSKTKLMEISAVSILSPGIALLSFTYYIKNEHNKGGINDWLVRLIWLFWIIAFIDVTCDKLPGYAHIHHVFQHVGIWFIAYVAVTSMDCDISMFWGALTGSVLQGGRQVFHIGTGAASMGSATPVISTVEDVVAGVLMNRILG